MASHGDFSNPHDNSFDILQRFSCCSSEDGWCWSRAFRVLSEHRFLRKVRISCVQRTLHSISITHETKPEILCNLDHTLGL